MLSGTNVLEEMEFERGTEVNDVSELSLETPELLGSSLTSLRSRRRSSRLLPRDFSVLTFNGVWLEEAEGAIVLDGILLLLSAPAPKISARSLSMADWAGFVV